MKIARQFAGGRPAAKNNVVPEARMNCHSTHSHQEGVSHGSASFPTGHTDN